MCLGLPDLPGAGQDFHLEKQKVVARKRVKEHDKKEDNLRNREEWQGRRLTTGRSSGEQQGGSGGAAETGRGGTGGNGKMSVDQWSWVAAKGDAFLSGQVLVSWCQNRSDDCAGMHYWHSECLWVILDAWGQPCSLVRLPCAILSRHHLSHSERGTLTQAIGGSAEEK